MRPLFRLKRNAVLKQKRVSDRAALAAVRGKPCLVCHRPSDPCHIKSKGSGGPDAAWNLIPLCREHHSMQHKVGIVTFIKRYFYVYTTLIQLGWKLENDMLWHPKCIPETF